MRVFKAFLAYSIITLILGGLFGILVYGLIEGGAEAFIMFITALGIMVCGIVGLLLFVWAVNYLFRR